MTRADKMGIVTATSAGPVPLPSVGTVPDRLCSPICRLAASGRGLESEAVHWAKRRTVISSDETDDRDQCACTPGVRAIVHQVRSVQQAHLPMFAVHDSLSRDPRADGRTCVGGEALLIQRAVNTYNGAFGIWLVLPPRRSRLASAGGLDQVFRRRHEVVVRSASDVGLVYPATTRRSARKAWPGMDVGRFQGGRARTRQTRKCFFNGRIESPVPNIALSLSRMGITVRKELPRYLYM